MTRIGKKTEVGPHGYVQLVDVMGDDHRIVDAARVSYGVLDEERSEERDEKLIRYLMRHHHTSPFEQCEMAFIVKCPMDVWRQWIRHRTANVNEYSTRYTEAIDEAATTPPQSWRLQATTNHQGSEADAFVPLHAGEVLSEGERAIQHQARREYERRLKAGVAKEQARKDLPLSTYTTAYWKMDLHNLFHFLRLRMDEHAQLEIREFAYAVATFVADTFPLAWQAFLDYRVHGLTLTAAEVEALSKAIRGGGCTHAVWRAFELLDASERERKELGHKLGRLAGRIT